VAWHVRSGQRVTAGQQIATLETTKATFDVNADRDGFIAYTATVKSIVAVAAPLAWISDDADASIPTGTGTRANEASGEATADSRFTRKALRRMRDVGLTAADFKGSYRVDVADVERAAVSRVHLPQIPSDGTASRHDDNDP